MTAAFIILFRETLEIAIILSIILVATRGIAGRMRWILAGIGGGIAGSAVVALCAERISSSLEGMGQEIFNAGILLVAVVMIGWTVVWMQTHGRQISQKIKQVGKAVHEGELPLYALATVISITMWREGAEIVLFMTGILSTSSEPLSSIILGGLAGTFTAAVIGLLLYAGLIRVSSKHFFTFTSVLLTLLAAGMSMQAAGFLIAADVVPDWLPQLWDSSHLLSQESLPGRILHAMLGYSDSPSGTQLVFYVATLAVIVTLLKLTRTAPKATA